MILGDLVGVFAADALGGVTFTSCECVCLGCISRQCVRVCVYKGNQTSVNLRQNSIKLWELLRCFHAYN